MKKAIALFLCGCFLLTMCSCGSQEPLSSEFTAMNTLIEIRVFSSFKLGKKETTEHFIEITKGLDSVFDANNEESDISLINNSENSVNVSKETAEIIKKSIYATEITDGAFDITIMPVLKLWGFDNGNYGVPKDEEIQKALELVGNDKISVEGTTVTKAEDTQISLGGIAKGYAGDKLLEFARLQGVSAVVSLGGNIVLCGENEEKGFWTVGVKNPLSQNDLCCTFTHKGNVSIVTSGGYERSFEKDGKTYHHIIDTKTGEPAKTDLLSVTVIGEDGALCDAFSTALFIMGKDKAVKFAKEHNDFEYIFITEDNEIITTDGVTDVEVVSDDFKLIHK